MIDIDTVAMAEIEAHDCSMQMRSHYFSTVLSTISIFQFELNRLFRSEKEEQEFFVTLHS